MERLNSVEGASPPQLFFLLTLSFMEDFTPEYQIRINPDDLLMPIGIGNITEPEIVEAVRSPRAEWYESANLPRKDGGCLLIAPTSKRRFLLVALVLPGRRFCHSPG